MSVYLPYQSLELAILKGGDTLKGAAIACVLFVCRKGGGMLYHAYVYVAS